MTEMLTQLFALLNSIFKWSSRPQNQVSNIVKIYDEMSWLLDQTATQRVRVIKVHNGGGNIAIGKNLYATALYECSRLPLHVVRGEYERFLLDESMIRFVLTLLTDAVVHVEVEQLKPGFIKEVYKMQKITQSTAFLLKRGKKELFYLSISSCEGPPHDSDSSRLARMQMSADKIRALMARG